MITILGVALTNREKCAVEFQKILTKHGCDIRTRLGLHSGCENSGIILLEIHDDASALEAELKQHWEVQMMEFPG